MAPAAPPPVTNTVYAVWSGRIYTQPSQSHHPNIIETYTIVVRPKAPLAVGESIRLLALTPVSNYTPAHPLPYKPRLDINDPKVEGRLIRVRAIESSIVEFALENEARGAVTRMVYVAVQYVPNVTARLGMAERVYRWITRNLPDTRFIPLDDRVVVNETVSPATIASSVGPDAHRRLWMPSPHSLLVKRGGGPRKPMKPTAPDADMADRALLAEEDADHVIALDALDSEMD